LDCVVHASELVFANWSSQSLIAFGHPSQRFKVRNKNIKLIKAPRNKPPSQ